MWGSLLSISEHWPDQGRLPGAWPYSPWQIKICWSTAKRYKWISLVQARKRSINNDTRSIINQIWYPCYVTVSDQFCWDIRQSALSPPTHDISTAERGLLRDDICTHVNGTDILLSKGKGQGHSFGILLTQQDIARYLSHEMPNPALSEQAKMILGQRKKGPQKSTILCTAVYYTVCTA